MFMLIAFVFDIMEQTNFNIDLDICSQKFLIIGGKIIPSGSLVYHGIPITNYIFPQH